MNHAGDMPPTPDGEPRPIEPAPTPEPRPTQPEEVRRRYIRDPFWFAQPRVLDYPEARR